jgi:phospholipid/cholesterol/gamma-HCH transport system substrate-binding protein
MASQRSKMAVGIFVAAGLSIALAAVIWLGMSRFLQKGAYYVTYFDESVQGLNKDSPVKYRGVSIGRVESIGVAPDSKLIEVVLEIEPSQEVESDMVSQLKTVGITGSMFVEIDRSRPGEPGRTLDLDFPTKYPVIPSRPSEITELLKGLDDVIDQIRAIDVEGITGKIMETLDGAGRVMAEADVKGLSGSIKEAVESWKKTADSDQVDAMMSSIQQAAHRLDSTLARAAVGIERLNSLTARIDVLVDRSEEPVQNSLEGITSAVEDAGRLMKGLNELAGETDSSVSSLTRQMSAAAQNLEEATDNINRLTELLAEHPSRLFFGQPPPPRLPQPRR